jgi:hypothetical protein
MKKKLLLALVSIAGCVGLATAQDWKDKDKGANSSGLALSIGGSATYYYGPGSRNFGKFERDRVNWQVNGLLGITIARDKGGHRTMLAAFGTYGFNNRSTMKQILADQGYISTALEQSTSNNFYQLEGGLLIAEVLRLSTGVGQQNFNEQTLASTDGIQFNTSSLRYLSSTVGLNLNLGSVAWVINVNVAYGKDFEEAVLTPSTGLMLRF